MISKFTRMTGALRTVIATFVPSLNRVEDPLIVRIIKYLINLGLLGMAIFIFVIWPVGSYTPEGFDQWSDRMAALPEEVWYILFALILSWITAGMFGGSKSDNTPPPTVEPPQDFMDANFQGFTDKDQK